MKRWLSCSWNGTPTRLSQMDVDHRARRRLPLSTHRVTLASTHTHLYKTNVQAIGGVFLEFDAGSAYAAAW